MLRDSFRNSRASFHEGDIESARLATPATIPSHSPGSPQLDEVLYQQGTGRVPSSTYERDWVNHHHDDVVEFLDAIGACS